MVFGITFMSNIIKKGVASIYVATSLFTSSNKGATATAVQLQPLQSSPVASLFEKLQLDFETLGGHHQVLYQVVIDGMQVKYVVDDTKILRIQYVVNDANISAFGLPPHPTHVSYLWPLAWGWYVVGNANIQQCQYPPPLSPSLSPLLLPAYLTFGHQYSLICVQPSPPAPTHASYLWMSAWIQYVVSDMNIPPPSYLLILPLAVGMGPVCSQQCKYMMVVVSCSVYGLSKLESKLNNLQLLVHMATWAL
ncbi:hypothetical protein EDC04DRAFT_2597797 [Pisolithus marmoratus]|nr:hypothetical protein EDC04DRAFT_2597797 [Pisolithus marmoratus]